MFAGAVVGSAEVVGAVCVGVVVDCAVGELLDV